jgi:Uri superfamily endonuclease
VSKANVTPCNDLCRGLLASELPAGGTYTVWLWLPAPRRIVVGRLGAHHFPRGYYTYTGSARRGMRARLHRHVHGAVTRHWHIDYLRPHVCVLGWQVYADDSQPECRLNTRLARQGRVVVPKFGASDCRCASHLLYYPERWRPVWHIPATVAPCQGVGNVPESRRSNADGGLQSAE